MNVYATCICLQADLIHIGARFTPCMRDDVNIRRELVAARNAERNSACCVRNDGSGCLQTTDDDCSVLLLQSHSINIIGCKWSSGRVSDS